MGEGKERYADFYIFVGFGPFSGLNILNFKIY